MYSKYVKYDATQGFLIVEIKSNSVFQLCKIENSTSLVLSIIHSMKKCGSISGISAISLEFTLKYLWFLSQCSQGQL